MLRTDPTKRASDTRITLQVRRKTDVDHDHTRFTGFCNQFCNRFCNWFCNRVSCRRGRVPSWGSPNGGLAITKNYNVVAGMSYDVI